MSRHLNLLIQNCNEVINEVPAHSVSYSGHAIEQVGAQLSNLLVEYGIRGYGLISICHVYLRMRARHVRTIYGKSYKREPNASSIASKHPPHPHFIRGHGAATLCTIGSGTGAHHRVARARTEELALNRA